ncbi:MAG TPA: TSUP family transporter, partial [Thermodesulfobacteriota bacterium]|nr:TSUP family transporter [Thermodesulfobacteriota bacterium]
MTALVAIGLAAGVAAGLLGVGGGFVLVPLLVLLGHPLHSAIAATLAFVVLTALSGTVRHLAQRSADWALALPLTAGSALTAAAAAAASLRLSERTLALLFAAAAAA